VSVEAPTRIRPPFSPGDPAGADVAEQPAAVGSRHGTVHARAWIDPDLPPDPPVVLVHGLGVAGRMNRPVARLLARRFHVYAPDLATFGESDGPERVLDLDELADGLADWMEARGLARAIVVGTSLGCQVAAELARRHPDRCGVLVLASPTVDNGRRRWLSQIPRWQVEQATQSLRLRALQIDDYRKCGVGRVARTFARALHHPVEDVVAGVRRPTLVCWATSDPLLSRRWVEHLASRAPHGELVTVPGALHAMSHESPLELARVVSHFVDRHPIDPEGS
jgi:2-hydroxy-6-oxonona-2,4-dienedioate hydrolase